MCIYIDTYINHINIYIHIYRIVCMYVSAFVYLSVLAFRLLSAFILINFSVYIVATLP